MTALNSNLLARIAGTLAGVMGLVVLSGWLLNVPMLKSVFPGLVTMKANTALGLAMGGSAVAFLASSKNGTGVRFSYRAAGVGCSSPGRT